MAELAAVILRRHQITHVPALRVDPVVFQPVFHVSCSMRNCNGQCCAEGVLLDPTEKERILAHTGLIQKYLETDMEHDPANWFDGVVGQDMDFPSGECEGTASTERGCVFLDSRGLCTLQKAAVAEGMDKFTLKPFYCVAYPLTIDAGVLTVEDADFTSRPSCCSAVDQGSQHITDVCREELEFMLGADGAQELELAAQTRR